MLTTILLYICFTSGSFGGFLFFASSVNGQLTCFHFAHKQVSFLGRQQIAPQNLSNLPLKECVPVAGAPGFKADLYTQLNFLYMWLHNKSITSSCQTYFLPYLQFNFTIVKPFNACAFCGGAIKYTAIVLLLVRPLFQHLNERHTGYSYNLW